MELGVVVTHESGQCSSARVGAARGTHVFRRRATRRAVVCWSLTLLVGPCALPLVSCARPNAPCVVAGGLLARLDTHPMRLTVGRVGLEALGALLRADEACVRRARDAVRLACGPRLPLGVRERIARHVLTVEAPTQIATRRGSTAAACSPSRRGSYAAAGRGTSV
jgi:hypothetical protein